MAASWFLILAVGIGLLIVLALATLGIVLVVVQKKNVLRPGSGQGHPEIAECTACGFVAPAGKAQCPNCGGKIAGARA